MVKKNMRRPRRKQIRRKRSKNPAKVSQLMTKNRFTPKSQVFVKTQLAYNNPLALEYVGAGTSLTSIGGATVGSMPDFSNITALYNRYKMLSVTYNWNLQTTGALSLYNYDLPKMLVRYNYDANLTSAAVPTKLEAIPNVKQFQFTQDKTQFSYTYYPRANEPVYLSGISTGYKLAKQQYIDVAYSNVPMYGIMWYVDNLGTGLKLSLDITYKVAFKYEN